MRRPPQLRQLCGKASSAVRALEQPEHWPPTMVCHNNAACNKSLNYIHNLQVRNGIRIENEFRRLNMCGRIKIDEYCWMNNEPILLTEWRAGAKRKRWIKRWKMACSAVDRGFNGSVRLSEELLSAAWWKHSSNDQSPTFNNHLSTAGKTVLDEVMQLVSSSEIGDYLRPSERTKNQSHF